MAQLSEGKGTGPSDRIRFDALTPNLRILKRRWIQSPPGRKSRDRLSRKSRAQDYLWVTSRLPRIAILSLDAVEREAIG